MTLAARGARPRLDRRGLSRRRGVAHRVGEVVLQLDLAAAFRETSNKHYQRTWELLVDSWIEQVQVGTRVARHP